jgi:hypothetical protein
MKTRIEELEASLAWCVAVIEHEVEPPKSCGACGTPNAQCDGGCVDAVRYAEGMRIARMLLSTATKRQADKNRQFVAHYGISGKELAEHLKKDKP